MSIPGRTQLLKALILRSILYLIRRVVYVTLARKEKVIMIAAITEKQPSYFFQCCFGVLGVLC